ncbi:GST-like protein [Bradyrhizobium ottawaense]
MADILENQPADYEPPKVWSQKKSYGGAFGSSNRSVSGSTFERELPIGRHQLQLYSQGTPNGQKVTILLEELLAAGHAGAEYDAWLIDIFKGDQFGSGFTEINPNSKIPALVDHSADPLLSVFESGSIMVYLAEKFGAFLPTELHARIRTFNWLMWQMGTAPFVGGGLGHFYAYAPLKIEYAIDRYAMEVKRQLHVLDTHLAKNEFLAGDEYTIADMAVWPWQPAAASTASTTRTSLSASRNIPTSCAGIARSASALLSSEGGSSIALRTSPVSSPANVTTPPISTRF